MSSVNAGRIASIFPEAFPVGFNGCLHECILEHCKSTNFQKLQPKLVMLLVTATTEPFQHQVVAQRCVVIVTQLLPTIRSRCMMMVHELTGIYKPTISRQREKLMEVMKGQAEAAAKSELAKRMRVLKGFYTVEMAIPGSAEARQISADVQLIKDFMKNKRYLFITVRQAWLLFLVGLEVFLWFFIGETIGKGHIVGYKV